MKTRMWQVCAGLLPAMLLLAACGAPAAVGQPRSVASDPTAASPAVVAGAAGTATPVAAAATPTASPEPAVLAVTEEVWAQCGYALADVATAHPELQVVLATGDTDGVSADATIAWQRNAPGEGDLALRSETWAVVHHVTAPDTPWAGGDVSALLAAGVPGYTLAVGGDGADLCRAAGIAAVAADAVHLADWAAAKEYVATHRDAWAVLPWAAVDFRVGMVPGPGINGTALARYLVLSGAEHLPAALAEAVTAALYEPAPATLELVAVGDIMLGRTVGELIQAHSPEYPFAGQGIQPLLAGADLALGNLECPISARGERRPKGYEFRAAPEVVAGLSYAGFDLLSLANNHSGDYGPLALQDTLDYLQAAQIVPLGAGQNLAAAREAKIMWVEGLRVAFLAYDQVGPDWLWATDDAPGCAPMRIDQMAADVQAARRQADVVVVVCHWGYEYSAYATASQQDAARALGEAGAALVIGGHAHVVQGVEYQDHTFVAYGLGNFVFDMRLSRETQEGLVLRCLLDASGVKAVELIACDGGISQPSLAAVEGDNQALARVWRVTREKGGLPQ